MLKIGKKQIRKDQPTFVIAEIAQAHDGSLGYAHSFIDIAKRCGANAVKFQMHYSENESTLDEKFRIKLSSQYKNRFDYWKRMEFSMSQWLELKKHCENLKLEFMVSVFSNQAVKNASALGLNNIKISSGEIFNQPLIDFVCQKFSNIIFSTGMIKKKELDEKINFFRKKKKELSVLHCISKYPVKKKELSLDFIDKLKLEFPDVVIGYSDHSGDISPPIFAISKGINILELHLAMDKEQYGPDTNSSLIPKELELVCRFKEDFFIINNQKKTREEIVESITNKDLFKKSLALNIDKKKGEIVLKNDVVLKKPGSGIPYSDLNKVIGRKLLKNVSKKKLLRYDDLS